MYVFSFLLVKILKEILLDYYKDLYKINLHIRMLKDTVYMKNINN